MTARLSQRKKIYWPVGVVLLMLTLIIPIVSFAATSPTINEWPTPVAFSGPNSIVTGPDGNLWFAQGESNQIGKINPSTGVITEHNLPPGPPNTYSQMPDGITVGPDGNLWFGIISPVSGPPLLGKMTISGSLTEYPLTSSMLLPSSLITGPDGNIWFAAFSGGYIGAMNTSGVLVHSYAVSGGPEGLSVGP
jgi:virginiamycin B lyase